MQYDDHDNHDDGEHDHDHNHDDDHYGNDGDHHGKVRQGLSVQHVMLRDAQRNCKWCTMYVGERQAKNKQR